VLSLGNSKCVFGEGQNEWHSPTEVGHQPFADFSACYECRKPWFESSRHRDEPPKQCRGGYLVVPLYFSGRSSDSPGALNANIKYWIQIVVETSGLA
jgi:hypothetical protein